MAAFARGPPALTILVSRCRLVPFLPPEFEFDIDEAGAGGIFGSVTNAEVLNSYDEGLDFDASGDEGENEVDLDLVNIHATGNIGDAIKITEDDETLSRGNVSIRMTNIHTEGEVQIEEVDDGNLVVEIRDSVIGSIEDDLKIFEVGDGNLDVLVTYTEIGKDVEIAEEDAGDLDVAIIDSVIADDLEIVQEGTGTGTADLSGTTIGDVKELVNVDEI